MPLKPLSEYDQNGFYCEMLGEAGAKEAKLSQLWERLVSYDAQELEDRASEATGELLDLGITFTVYSERDAIDRILPFDIIPRVLSAADWQHIEAGVIQRVTALNLLLQDLYGDGKIITGWHTSGGTGAQQCEFPQRDGRLPTAVRHLSFMSPAST